jgi:CRP/FNR family cyclic AMP-dependent transcriptional regulator
MGYSERKFKRNDVLFSEGQPAKCIFFIQSGIVSIQKKKGTGRVEVARVRANEVIGELSFFDKKPRSATVIALTDVRALEIDYESLQKIYQAVPPYFQKIISAVADRLRGATDVIKRLEQTIVYGESSLRIEDEPMEADLDLTSEPPTEVSLDDVAKAEALAEEIVKKNAK